MWHELRERIGDDAFFAAGAGRGRPTHDNGNADRDDYRAWLEEQTGEELTAFFDAWLLGETTPRATDRSRLTVPPSAESLA